MTSLNQSPLDLFCRICPKYAALVQQAPLLSQPLPKLSLLEANLWFASIPNPTSIDTLYVFGLDISTYPLLKEWLKQGKNRILFYLEDNFSVLNTFFSSEPSFSLDILQNPQIVLFPFQLQNKKEKMQISKNFDDAVNATFYKNYYFVSSPQYEISRKELSNLLYRHFHLTLGNHLWHLGFFTESHLNDAMRNIYQNLFLLPKMRNGDDLFSHFQGIPTLICAAGPSIAEQLLLIKTLKNRAILFGAGTGMNTLNAQGIFPHFGCGIDPNPSSLSRMITNAAYEIPYYCITQFQKDAGALLHGPLLFFRGPESYRVDRWLHIKLGRKKQKNVPFVISTTCACLALAAELGCNPIIFAGLDLSYTDQKRYVDSVTAHPSDKKQERVFIKSLPKEHLLPAKNLKGKEIFTRIDWLNEAGYYNTFAQKHPEFTFVNATQEGLSINQIPHMSLEEVVDKYLPYGFDIDNWVHAEVLLSEELSVTRDEVQSALFEWKTLLEKGRTLIRSMMQALLALEESYEKSGDLPENPLSTSPYIELRDKFKKEEAYHHFFKFLGAVYNQLSTRERLRLLYHPDSYTKKERVFQILKFELLRLVMLEGVANNQEKIIEEILQNAPLLEDPPSKSSIKQEIVPQQGEKYAWENGILVLEDPELDLYYSEPFSPQRVDSSNKPEKSMHVFAAKKEGLPEGECLLLDNSGKVKAQSFYREGKLHGPSMFFSKGHMLAKGWFLEDQREGKNWQYDLSGNLCSLTRYRKGAFQGKQEYFYKNGVLKTLMHFSNGILEGSVQLFYPDGSLKRELYYVKGLLEGKERFWNPQGVLRVEAEYRQGKPIGKALSWDDQGCLERELVYLDSPDHYDERRWNKEGKLIYEQRYVPTSFNDQLKKEGEVLSETIQSLKEKLKKLKQ